MSPTRHCRLITGLVFASYFVRIPSLKIELGLSDGRLGILLMLPLLSGLLAMQLTGRLVARLGSAPIVRTTMVAPPLSLIGLTLVDGAEETDSPGAGQSGNSPPEGEAVSTAPEPPMGRGSGGWVGRVGQVARHRRAPSSRGRPL